MAKFYVQSGSFRGVIGSRVVVQSRRVGGPPSDAAGRPVEGGELGESTDQPPRVLADRIQVDPRGYDHADATSLRTTDLIAQWSQMVVTLDRLQQMLAA